MTNDEIRALLALEAKATPGPWEREDFSVHDQSYGTQGVRTADSDGYQAGGNWWSRTICQTLYGLRVDVDTKQGCNMTFIAAARNAIRPLAEEVLRLREQNVKLTEALQAFIWGTNERSRSSDAR